MSHEFQHQFGIVCVPPVKQDICIGHQEHIVLILGTRIQQPERDDIKIQGKILVIYQLVYYLENSTLIN